MMGYKNVGNTVAEWDDAAPFVFSLSEEVGGPDARHSTSIKVDLTGLREGFTDDFLLHLKDRLIDWRNRISLNSVKQYANQLQRLFRNVITLSLFDTKTSVIDETFLLALDSVKEKMSRQSLVTLRLAFTSASHSPLWEPRLHADLFPQLNDNKGFHGRQISRILAKSLTRAACIYILSRCEQAYELGEMDIGLFAFANLAFAVFCRPESYRQIQLGDLVFDEKSHAYFLYIAPVKAGVVKSQKICYKINEPLAIILQKQRQSVVSLYGHLVDPQDIGKLALFPAKQLTKDNSAWIHAYANEHFGMYKGSEFFTLGYPRAIQSRFLMPGCTIGANVLRHTVGTLLAQTGVSARTIQAVLKHATDIVCKAYVDIAFHGLTEALSDAMRPAFDMHLPVFNRFRSKSDPVNAEQAIRSDDLATGKIELTGECGKLIQCENAPITCYGCIRFIPCWDADHGINLATAQREIDEGKRMGKPYQTSVERWTTAKYHIILVMNAADRYLDGCTQEPHP